MSGGEDGCAAGHPRVGEAVVDIVGRQHGEAAVVVVVVVPGEEVAAEVSGTDEACAELLAALVARGYRIVEFKQQRANLEEIFMNVTKGVVQ